jgi:DNA-binding NarL/FixJ family response regulator
MSTPKTIYLADDHQIVIDGLKLLISDEASMKVVGHANDGETAFKKIQEWKPDVALIDLRMPGLSGLDIILKLSRTMKDTKFVILSMEEEPRHIKDAMRAGASGYLLKNTGKFELMKCLNTVLNGEKYFPNMPVKKGEDKPIFTPREFEIVKLVIDEYTTPQIAEKLHLSPLTVETHRKSICRKTNTHNALGLIKFLRENNIAF